MALQSQGGRMSNNFHPLGAFTPQLVPVPAPAGGLRLYVRTTGPERISAGTLLQRWPRLFCSELQMGKQLFFFGPITTFAPVGPAKAELCERADSLSLTASTGKPAPVGAWLPSSLEFPRAQGLGNHTSLACQHAGRGLSTSLGERMEM